MASTVNLPIVGPANKGTVIGVGIGGLALAGYMIIRKQKTAKTQAAAAAAASAQAQASYGYAQSAYGYGNVYDNGYYGYGASGGFNPTGYYGYGTPTPNSTTLPAANTTNAQWTQAAIAQLGNEGYDPQTVSAALGAYITDQPVTAAQQAIIQTAIAVEGYPPQSGANGYPPSISVQGTPGGGTGGGQKKPPPSGGGGQPSGGGGQPSGGGGPQQINVNGQTLEYGLPLLEQAGWTINSVRAGGGVYAQASYPQSLNQSKITSTTYHQQGVAGQNFANSVDVVATP